MCGRVEAGAGLKMKWPEELLGELLGSLIVSGMEPCCAQPQWAEDCRFSAYHVPVHLSWI